MLLKQGKYINTNSGKMIDFSIAINNFDSILLSDMDNVKLLNRVDKKYLVDFNKLERIIRSCSDSFFVLSVGGERIVKYHTTYFDTDNFDLFQAHQRGCLNRYKIRYRRYINTGDIFLEIKLKTNTGRTKKNRMKINSCEIPFGGLCSNFISDFSGLNPSLLKPKIDTKFDRITLVSKDFKSRVTIDVNIKMMNIDDNVCIENLSVVEVKQERGAGVIAMDKILREYKCVPSGFSKYCIGLSLLKSNLKQNNFAPVVKMLKRNNYVKFS